MAFLKYLGIGILLLVDVVIIISVLMSSSKSSGLSSLVSGSGAETFFGKNKGQDLDAKLTKVLKIAGIVFVVLSVLLTTLINRTAS